MEAVEFTLASLWSRVPNAPLDDVLLGIIPSEETAARDHVRYLAVEVVGTFTPEDSCGPPARGGDPAAQPASSEEESNAGP